MNGVTIYMEGGGRGNTRDLRRGIAAFLGPLRELARSKTLRFRVTPCGSREDTWRRFLREAGRAGPGETCVLLVDSDRSVRVPPRAHLRETHGWDLSGVPENTVHLMVQVMETWIVADPGALAGYYGQDFGKGKLPKRADLEEEPKERILNALKNATKHTSKGAYKKLAHAAELLWQIDPERVKARCRHCKRFFEELERIVGEA